MRGHQVQSKSVRFEVLVNGERRCVAGVGEFGVVSATVDWVARHPAYRPSDYSPEAWSGERLSFRVGGLHAQRGDEHLTWAFGDLAVGDEVLIRVLGPGEHDEPLPTASVRFT